MDWQKKKKDKQSWYQRLYKQNEAACTGLEPLPNSGVKKMVSIFYSTSDVCTINGSQELLHQAIKNKSCDLWIT